MQRGIFNPNYGGYFGLGERQANLAIYQTVGSHLDKNMKLQDIVRTNDWLSVELTLIKLYPDQEENLETYKEIFQKLREMIPTDNDIQIILEKCFDEESYEESTVDVSGIKFVPDKSNLTESLAIEFVPWSEWLGMSIHERTLKSFNELEIISHCLFEMTFVGFEEEEIQDQFSSLKKSVDDYKNMTDEEKQANTKSLDDFLNELDDE